ncbi:MAG: hypothetical protein ACRDBM_18155 [Sporomusa sp.]
MRSEKKAEVTLADGSKVVVEIDDQAMAEYALPIVEALGKMDNFLDAYDFATSQLPTPPGMVIVASLKGGKVVVTIAKIATGADKVLDLTKGPSKAGNLIKFKGDEAVNHFEKHSKEIMNALGKNEYNLKNYVEDANHVIQTGTYVPELNGYVQLIGGTGSAKYAFVGLDRLTENITTFHIKTVGELAKKAPSLGLIP